MGACVKDASEGAVAPRPVCLVVGSWEGGGKSTQKGGEAALHPWGHQLGCKRGPGSQRHWRGRWEWLLGWGNAWTSLPSSLGAPSPEVPMASLYPLPLRTGLAGPLGWGSRSGRPFECERMPGSPRGRCTDVSFPDISTSVPIPKPNSYLHLHLHLHLHLLLHLHLHLHLHHLSQQTSLRVWGVGHLAKDQVL